MSRYEIENSHGEELDGKGNIKPTPFDAHEQSVRSSDPEKEPEEFPKAVDHVDHPDGKGKEAVVVNSAEEEAEYLASKASDEKAADEP